MDFRPFKLYNFVLTVFVIYSLEGILFDFYHPNHCLRTILNYINLCKPFVIYS